MDAPRTPLVDALRAGRALRREPMQIPGHKNYYSDAWVEAGSHPLGFDLLHDIIRDDVSLQGGVDDNQFTFGYDEDAEDLYAQSIGADHTRFLVNGSTQGNLSALLAVCTPGHKFGRRLRPRQFLRPRSAREGTRRRHDRRPDLGTTPRRSRLPQVVCGV